MISIKRHLDRWRERPAPVSPRTDVGVYLSLLSSVVRLGARAVPTLGPDLESRLSAIAAALKPDDASRTAPAALGNIHEQVEKHLSEWARRAPERDEANERELGEIVAAMRNAVDSLTTRVERTAEASQQSLKRLREEMEQYRALLSDTEKLSVLDPVTGLANRRGFEDRMAFRIQSGSRFSLILIDLDGFKEVNDRFGHIAGDEVLKNVGARLRAQFPLADLVSRWGGDEFAVIITCGQDDAEASVSRIRHSPIGECRMMADGQHLNVGVRASFGVAEWDGAESGTDLLARADASMYRWKTDGGRSFCRVDC